MFENKCYRMRNARFEIPQLIKTNATEFLSRFYINLRLKLFKLENIIQ